MTPTLTEEHDELRRVVRRFLAERSPSQEVRRLIEGGRHLDREVWSQMASQLGLQGIAIPEEHGGSGFGPVELGIVLEEMGRALLVAPYFSTVALAGQTLTASGDEAAQARWLPGIAEGTLTATLAVAEESGVWDLGSVECRAEEVDGQWVLEGTKHFVVDGATADLVLVVARVGDRVGVFAVEAGAAGLEREETAAVDLTRPLASLRFERTPATRLAPQREVTEWLPRVGDLVMAALAAEMVGGADRCLEMAVDYAKTREQFGRPVGSFQAVKHKCANLLLDVESGRSAASYASAAMSEPAPEPTIAATVALAHCARAFTQAAKECLQIHGGIGYTWEHDVHLFLRRAKSSELLFGGPAVQRRRLAELVGIAGAR
ncbi:acyl-CoA dehydrogenase family protein [Nocardioides sp.]|uniref:acyl-CoA dehydrogenase family protein n=1 Tax=Nocardioides sp. TaxID=35761 RepID=UPI0039E6481C